MTQNEYKELKRALWEIEMKKQGKDIPYLEYQDIMEIVLEQRKTGGRIDLPQEAYEFYQKDFMKVLQYLEAQEQEALREKVIDFRAQVEKDKETAIQVMLKQNANIPWQVRKSEEQIKQDVQRAVGNPATGDLSYRKALAYLCGGELKEDGNTVQLDERRLNERIVQENFDKQQAERKAKAQTAEQNEKPIL